MRALVAFLVAIASLGFVFAQEPDTAEVDARTETISKTLRCVVCQNQSIHDSNAPLAEDMRALVRKRVEAGDSDADVREYLRERYGDYVLMQPPLQGNTLILWFGPLALVVMASGWFIWRGRKTSATEPVEMMSDVDRERVRRALSGEDSETPT